MAAQTFSKHRTELWAGWCTVEQCEDNVKALKIEYVVSFCAGHIMHCINIRISFSLIRNTIIKMLQINHLLMVHTWTRWYEHVNVFLIMLRLCMWAYSYREAVVSKFKKLQDLTLCHIILFYLCLLFIYLHNLYPRNYPKVYDSLNSVNCFPRVPFFPKFFLYASLFIHIVLNKSVFFCIWKQSAEHSLNPASEPGVVQDWLFLCQKWKFCIYYNFCICFYYDFASSKL